MSRPGRIEKSKGSWSIPILLTSWTLLLLPAIVHAADDPQHQLEIYGGSTGGYYQPIACFLSFLAARAGVDDVIVVSTDGSIENLEMLLKNHNRSSMGLVQETDLVNSSLGEIKTPILDRLLVRESQMEKAGMRISVSASLENEGSDHPFQVNSRIANIERFLGAFSQFDRQPEVMQSLALVTVINYEQLHVISLNPDIQVIPEPGILSDMTIATGPPESGSARDMVFFLDAAGVKFNPSKHHFMESSEQAMESLSDEQTSIVFLTGAVPLPLISDFFSRNVNYHLVDLSRHYISRALHAANFRKIHSIEKSAYRKDDDGSVTALTDRAILVATASVPSDLIKTMIVELEKWTTSTSNAIELRELLNEFPCPTEDGTNWLFGNRFADKFSNLIQAPSLGMEEIELVSEHTGIPPHPAVELLKNEGFVKGHWIRYLGYLWFLAGFALIVMVLFWLPRTRVGLSDWSLIISMLLVLLLIWIVGAVFMHIFERASPYFSTLPLSFWSIATYLFSGFEDKNPVTLGGRIVSVVMILSGIGIVASLTGEIASKLTARRMDKDSLPLRRFSNHVIVCVSNVSQLSLVNNLKEQGSYSSSRWRFVVMMPNPPREQHPDRSPLKSHGIRFLRGDPESVQDLQRAGINKAYAVVMIANHEQKTGSGTSIAKMLGAVKAARTAEESGSSTNPLFERFASIRRFIGLKRYQLGTRRCRVIALCDNSMSRELGCQAGADELVEPAQFGYGLMAQALLTPWISTPLHHLITSNTRSMHFQWVRNSDLAHPGDIHIPREHWQSSIVGRPFREVAQKAVTAELIDGKQLLVIGYQNAGGKLTFNPMMGVDPGEGRGPEHLILAGDSLLALASWKN